MKVTSFGEVLWDDLPSGKVLGGAPLNVLVRLCSLGADCSIISCRGNDADGEELLRLIESKNIATDLLQVSDEQATGLVKVTLDSSGCASYDIVYPCAWDKIRFEETALKRVAESDAFIYGSLSTRDEVSRNTLERLLEQAKFKIFDVNLRPPHYDTDRLLSMMKQADLVKMNDDELYELARAYGSKQHSVEQNIRYLAELCGVSRICVTLGSHGAVYFDDGEIYHHSGFRVKVADTVGSGDSFLAGLTYQLLNRAHPRETLTFACALGAMVAACRGATPEISRREIENFINPV
ncbi:MULTISPECIES: carbohydrate kinase [unclassified Neisseria]|uniref:carbohydrate kinase family protein n=1 Tax=unclassified Neisseria TaxID=2623750 RepID=UPI002666D186|nr:MULTISPECIES: carbohydrate kinase [unclassified Neisseria]MDO1510244.1 carbohydrate kinase [Neisseria sp. MVDL19-042950]MDO1516413.1 carbohydrate kinase [Neisseria sp. MVDL18-041461]MDO1563561.1 carbohydrate kinase [Neisseria sp. MVDL20-010259]